MSNRTFIRRRDIGFRLVRAFALVSVVADAQSTQLPTDVAFLMPTASAPVEIPADDKTSQERWHKQIEEYMKLPADQVTAHPAATDFPGAVPADAQAVSQEVTVALNLPRWHSTGLYAAPGAHITVRVSPADAARGFSVQIGSHTDNLAALSKWVRFPRITRSFPITQTVTTIANAFGGLIYVDVPRNESLGGWNVPTFGGYGWLGENPSAVPGTAKLRIEGAVAAPLFIAGKTTPEQWKSQLQRCRAPWGELQSERVILTVESKHLDAVSDPNALLEFWGKVIDAEAQLAGWPRQPAPPERIVVDREISAGWMHSGYPIMAHLPSEHDLLKLPALQTKGDWGFFHELGHNHEAEAYTFGGDYVEVNVNLFSMYVMQKVVGREMTAHPNLAHLDRLLEARLGPQKKNDPWGNLAMYIKTIQAFGWDPLQKTMASYSTPDGSAGIKTREQKMDQWVLRYSLATGKNLVAYYDLFDVTCSQNTKVALKDLPIWMPPDLVKYGKRS